MGSKKVELSTRQKQRDNLVQFIYLNFSRPKFLSTNGQRNVRVSQIAKLKIEGELYLFFVVSTFNDDGIVFVGGSGICSWHDWCN